MTKLSICIPTYNRAKCLSMLLDSIVQQYTSDVEVVVSDNASADNTAEVVSSYKSKMPNLKYVLQSENIGADRNFLAVVENASGEYAWLMGDDDRLEPGAVGAILRALAQWPDIAGIVTGVTYYDMELRAVTGKRILPPTIRFRNANTVFEKIVEQLGFLSAIIVNRQMWGDVCSEGQMLKFQNQYMHVYIIGRMMQRFGGWGLLQEACVGYRTGNDRLLLDSGCFQRMKVDVVGYEQIARALFGPASLTYKRANSRIFSKIVLRWLGQIKINSRSSHELWNAAELLYRYYKREPAFWYAAVPILAAPKWFSYCLRAIRRQIVALAFSR
jgi:abequosyltransferase